MIVFDSSPVVGEDELQKITVASDRIDIFASLVFEASSRG